MPGEARDPTWGPQPAAAPAVHNDVSAVSGGRALMTGGQKLGFLVAGGIVLLGAIFLFNHQGRHHADSRQESSVKNSARLGGASRSGPEPGAG